MIPLLLFVPVQGAVETTALPAILTQGLCPPGAGVHAISTASEKKTQLHQAMYGQQDADAAWRASLHDLPAADIALMGICSDNGGGILRGANWGPFYLREALLKQALPSYLDIGDIRVIPHLLHDKYLNAATIQACQQAFMVKVRRCL